jgi:hypothetical protein
MPIPASINDLSTTAGSNSPAGSESPSLIDDYLRTYASYIALLRDQAASIVGSSSNASMLVSAASVSATFTADQVIVGTALSGSRYLLTSFSKVINLSTTGAGGMDTGAAPNNGFVAVYAIYNPTTQVSALLAVNATATAAAEIYAGGNMPAGYTASALVAVVATNGSGQFLPVTVQGRRVYIIETLVLNTTTQTGSPILFSIAGAAPKNAKSWRGQLQVTSNTAGVLVIGAIYGSSTSLGSSRVNTSNTISGGGINLPVTDLPITVSQSSHYTGTVSSGIMTMLAYLTSYKF